jgi:serine protease AprX
LKDLLKSNANRLSGGLGLSILSPSQGSGEIDVLRAAKAAPGGHRQWGLHSLGAGSMELARGNHHLVMDGVALTGERDVFGKSINTVALAAQELNGSSWIRGDWNGSTWTGSTWTGSTWTGSTWTGSTWTGSTWTGSTWTGSTWTGSTWTGSTWTGSTWTGSTWTSSAWSSAGWS